ncbi:apolipoprotein N-acyltransferase [Otariodibacter oris]|uniref:Apolipoprotein N-acyltransferase n=1 Tax=Otariodibacter oris TaxID=1032623 RepID=A0A420XG49_9PAST|nr:apolipoprotein N-acyltransferase [Otariodibacter oris]QGM80275.1 apolipoprotein N-acyltransferase [Otariodibacter oris]RKR71641.1 apolipoprotein N-acyltransferase [Otariodibacter oris]
MAISKNFSTVTIYLFALISGGIGILAYSPFDYWPVAFISAFGLLWLIITQSKKVALIGAFLWAVSYFSIGVNWVSVSMTQFGGVPEIVSYLAVLLLASYLALYPLLFTYLSQRFNLKNPWVLASLFSFTEYLREIVFTGFPWLQFGYTQIDSPFYGLAPITGVQGLTFFVILTSGYLVQIFCKWSEHKIIPHQPILVCIGILIFTAFTQLFTFVEDDTEKKSINISLIQGNIEQQMKWDPSYFNATLATYNRLITPLLGKSDVIIFPESAIPAKENDIVPILNQLDSLGRENHSEIILGTLYQENNQLFNSAVLLGDSNQPYNMSQAQRYNKHHLVPFGEYVPFGNLLDWMREVFILPINLARGNFIQPALNIANNSFNLAICYEIIFGDQVQQNQKQQQSDYLVTISNDAWFGTSSGPWQHLQMARMRALELGKPLIRATNTGITAFVDVNGQIIKQAPQFEATTLTQSMQPTKGTTPFTLLGHWLIYGISLMILVFSTFMNRGKNTK